MLLGFMVNGFHCFCYITRGDKICFDQNGQYSKFSRQPTMLSYTIDSTADDAEWDDLVMKTPVPPAEQTCAWAHSRAHMGWKFFRVKVYNEGVLCGGAQVLERTFRFGVKVGYAHNSPVVIDPTERKIGFVAWALTEACWERRLTYLVLRLPLEARNWPAQFTDMNFQFKPEAFPPFVRINGTLRIGLSSPEATLFATMRSTTRNEIRRAMRNGLSVRMGTRQDLQMFEKLLLDLCCRRRVTSNFPIGKSLIELWERFDARNWIRLLLVEANGEQPTCGLILSTLGTCVRAWASGWDGRFQKSFPTKLIYWEAIRWARTAGFQYFDMGGVWLDAFAAQPRPVGKEQDEGITFFKLGFGGDAVSIPKEICYFPNPILRHLAKLCHRGGLFAQLTRRLVARMS